jgi:rhodanese-related sulfurtransferase
VRGVDHRELRRLIADGAVVLDVLPRHEYEAAHIPGALHVPLARLWHEAPTRLARARPIVVYCRDSL